MCKAIGYAEGEAMQAVKITTTAHKALQLVKANEDIKQSEFASLAILEAIERDYPDVYSQVRKWAISNNHELSEGGKQP